MTRRSHARTLVLLLRDARGRFTRVRATLAEMAAARRPRTRRRRPLNAPVCVQLALF
jgi:hypothetical protein